MKRGIVDLDETVVEGLVYLSCKKIAKKKRLTSFKYPLVIGSGNAKVTSHIIFRDDLCVYANEGNYLKKLQKFKKIDGCVILSASGSKHAVKIAKKLSKKDIPIILWTNNKNAPAKKYVTATEVFDKIPEPYTYNFSTYLSMILSKTGEDPNKILAFLKKNYKKIPKNLGKYDSYFWLIPQKFEEAAPMIRTKFEELFGPKISARVFTFEHAMHAETVISSKKELFIGLGVQNEIFGENRLYLPISKNFDYASFISWAYYIIGKIQRQNPPYFKKNMPKYAKWAKKTFGWNIKPIVD